jgi:hypothetical protein
VRSIGLHHMAAVLCNRSFTFPFFNQSYDWKWPKALVPPDLTSAVEIGRPGIAAEATDYVRFRFPFARRFRGHHQPRCPGISPSTQAWSDRAATARHADSWCADRSASPWSFALNASRIRQGPVPVPLPSAQEYGRTAGSPDGVNRGAGQPKKTRRHRNSP